MTKRPLSRRDALKALAGITGAAALAGLPGKWQTPLVDVGALPAFAQCSPTATTAALRIVNYTATTSEVFAVGGDEVELSTIVAGGSTGCIEGLAPGEGWAYHDTPDAGASGADAPNSGKPYTWVAGELFEYIIGEP